MFCQYEIIKLLQRLNVLKKLLIILFKMIVVSITRYFIQIL